MSHLLRKITIYTVLAESTKSLMVLRPYQFYAVERIVNQVSSTEKNGYIWHTTGSGKTYTMTGNSETPGIMYLILEDMFNKILQDSEKTYDIRVSYVEIYNEVIRDLLVPN